MALEKWFYEQLEGQKPIDSAIDEMLRRITTVAFIGLLIPIACQAAACSSFSSEEGCHSEARALSRS
jgi:hypothetical protein